MKECRVRGAERREKTGSGLGGGETRDWWRWKPEPAYWGKGSDLFDGVFGEEGGVG